MGGNAARRRGHKLARKWLSRMKVGGMPRSVRLSQAYEDARAKRDVPNRAMRRGNRQGRLR